MVNMISWLHITYNQSLARKHTWLHINNKGKEVLPAKGVGFSVHVREERHVARTSTLSKMHAVRVTCWKWSIPSFTQSWPKDALRGVRATTWKADKHLIGPFLATGASVDSIRATNHALNSMS
jgi:hypothetical protein